MRFFRLIAAHLTRSKRRTFLTVSSIALALFLFCTLRTVMTSLDAGIRASDDTRLVVRHAASLVFPLPLAYAQRLEQVPGVQRVGYGNWFGGYYQDPKNQFTQFAVDGPSLFDIYPELLMEPSQREAFLAEQTACIAGKTLVDKYGWKLGDVIPITGTIYPGEWRLTLRGIYKAATPDQDENAIFFHWKYVNEAMPQGRKDFVGIYWLKVASPGDAPSVSAAVDAIYENSPQPTKTETEKAFQAGFIQMMGNVSLLLTILGSAIVFAILLVTLNTMMMAARERTTEIAILKTLGFTDGLVLRIVAAEALIVSLAGGILGCGLAFLIFRRVDFTAGGMFPNFRVLPETVGWGLLVALGMGLASGLVPALTAARLQIAGALRKVA
ncbi:MAG TPA: FtsX-like permease family protein [Candidatus Eisenbacteria bacterium]|nr:FtsX-like permease family protein [Candidatus Eisenbacteria bacterium]